MSSIQSARLKRERIGTSPDIGDVAFGRRHDFERQVVRPNALPTPPHGARSEPRAGAVGDPEIHRHAEQRDVEPAEIRLIRRLWRYGASSSVETSA